MANITQYRSDPEIVRETVDLHIGRAMDRLFNQTVRNVLAKVFTDEEAYEEAIKRLNERKRQVANLMREV